MNEVITCGLTCFNARDTIERAINSAFGQKWDGDLQVLVCDDFSTDGSREFLEQLSEQRKGLRIVLNEANLGVAGSRNRLIDEAADGWLIFFDDDDTSDPLRASIQREKILAAEKETESMNVLCYSDRLQNLPNGEVHYEKTIRPDRLISGEEMADFMLSGWSKIGLYGSCATCSMMARRDTFLRNGCFDENFLRGEDTEFNLRFALAGGYFTGVTQPLVEQMITSGHDKGLEKELEIPEKLLRKYESEMRKRGTLLQNRLWSRFRADWFRGKKFAAFMRLTEAFLRAPVATMRRLKSTFKGARTHRAFTAVHRGS
ncbi:MAG: glycosyltransferase [Verrucomicrobiota bacterium]